MSRKIAQVQAIQFVINMGPLVLHDASALQTGSAVQ